MTGLYLALLLVAIAGLVILDLRVKLFLAVAPWRAAIVLILGVVAFLLWDSGGVGLGVFFEGPSAMLLGVDIAPGIPLEEVFFLILLCLSAMEAFTAAQRLTARPRRNGTRR